jgi:hypothetical protein
MPFVDAGMFVQYGRENSHPHALTAPVLLHRSVGSVQDTKTETGSSENAHRWNHAVCLWNGTASADKGFNAGPRGTRGSFTI